MKTLIFVLCTLSAAAAFGQTAGGGAVLSSQPMVLEVPSHPEHASQKSLANEQQVLLDSGIVIAQGERPLWEVVSEPPVKPLGDSARALKQEHAKLKKAVIVWEN